MFSIYFQFNSIIICLRYQTIQLIIRLSKILIQCYQNQMQESRIKRSYRASRVSTDPQQQYHSVDVRKTRYPQQRRPSNPGDTLKQFQQQLSNMFTKKSFNYESLKDSRNMLKQRNKTLSIQMSNIRSDINQLKNKVIVYKKENQMDKKIGLALIDKVRSKTNERNVKLPAISSPFASNPYPYYPVPYPNYYPYPYPPQKQRDESEEQSEQERHQKPNKNKRKNLKHKKKMNRQQRQNNRIRLKKILKKVFLAAAYIFILKKLSKSIMSKRRAVFNKFWPDMFTKSTNGIRKWFSGGCKNFFNQMQSKSQAQLPIEGDESQPVIVQKKKTIKILINILIECLEDASESEVFEQVSQIVHIFCKHGSFIDNGVLTPQELETVCISQVHGYLRLDTNLQKSQIINFLFMKILIFNMLLQPWKYNEEKFNLTQNKQAYQNFYYVASVFYQLVVDVQNRLIESGHNENTDIGNWRKLKSKFRVKCSPSLCHLQSNYESGQMISGLISEQIIDSVFPSSFWKEQTSTLESIVQKMHAKLRKVHAKFINQTYNYKDLGRFGN